MIRIQSVSYRIGTSPILQDITADIPASGVTTLVGPNGAGKSTLLSLIARLEPLQSGTIHLDDLEIGKCPDRVLARHLSILPQSFDRPPGLTVSELVSFGRYPYHRGRPAPQDIEKQAEALEVLQLTDLADRRLDTLSGGQRQRAQIAMIFAQDTEYMLLDEPLNNLDMAATRSLMALLTEMSRNHGKAIVLVVHDINIAARYGDYIIAMKDGQICRRGTPAEIIDESLISDVFNTDARIATLDGEKIVLI